MTKKELTTLAAAIVSVVGFVFDPKERAAYIKGAVDIAEALVEEVEQRWPGRS